MITDNDIKAMFQKHHRVWSDGTKSMPEEHFALAVNEMLMPQWLEYPKEKPKHYNSRCWIVFNRPTSRVVMLVEWIWDKDSYGGPRFQPESDGNVLEQSRITHFIEIEEPVMPPL